MVDNTLFILSLQFDVSNSCGITVYSKLQAYLNKFTLTKEMTNDWLLVCYLLPLGPVG